MIAKVFSTINGLVPYKSPIATPVVSIAYTNSCYSVKSKGLRMDVYAWDQISDWPSWTTGTVFSGNCPLVKMYAGYGSPIFVPDFYSNKPFFGFKYSGFIKSLYTGTATFLLWGNGFAKLKYKNTFVAIDGIEKVELNELNAGSVSNDGKYVSASVTGTAGEWESFELCYLTKGRTNNPIGFCCHWSHASLSHPLVLSAGFTSYLDDGQPADNTDPIASVILQNIVSTSLNIKRGSSSEFRFIIPLVPSTGLTGYKYIQAGDYLQDIVTGQQIKKFRMIEFYEGYRIGATIEEVQKFSGQIKDWIIDRGRNTIEIICFDWASFLKDAINQGYPNPSDYWAAQYYKREVEGVAGDNKPRTFDAWGMTEAIECLCMNSYIDPVKFIGKKQFIDTSDNVINGGYLIENLSLDSDLRISLDRPYTYGNIGIAGGEIEPDDEYRWQVSIGETLIDQVEKITENYGYTWGFDRNGYLFVRPLNNPNTIKFWNDFTYKGSWTTGTNLGAIRGAYKYISAAGSVLMNSVYGSKFTLAIGPNTAGGTFHIKVQNAVLGIVATQDYNGYNVSDRFYYDGIDSSTGLNPCKIDIATGLTYDSYDITITRKIGELRINSLFAYDVDITSPVDIFRTGGEPIDPAVVTELSVESKTDEVRNDCLVVGKLLGIYSTLASDGTEMPINPNNPENEHILSRSVDLDSIANPTSSYFVGRPIQSVIVDPKISSTVRADWLSYEFVRRYRKAFEVKQPNYSMITNPLLEIGDCVAIKDDATDILATSQKMWVDSFEDTKEGNTNISRVILNTAEPWVSYEIKPIPSLSMYGGIPVIHVQIANCGFIGTLYQSISSIAETIYITGLHSSAIPTMGYLRLDQGNSKHEIIFYQGRYDNTNTYLTDCLRGKESTTATNHAANIMANLAIDPYLSEERGITPVITFDVVVPGWTKVDIYSEDNGHVDTLTGMEIQDFDKKWEKVEWGTQHTYAWGMLDMRGDWNKSCGAWKNNWNEQISIERQYYVRENFKESSCDQIEENYAKFYALISHRYFSKGGIYQYGKVGSPTVQIITKRGKPIDVLFSLDLSECYLVFQNMGMNEYPPNVYSGDENNGLGLKATFTGLNNETRLCSVDLKMGHHLISQSWWESGYLGMLNDEILYEIEEHPVVISGNTRDCSGTWNVYLGPPLNYTFFHSHFTRYYRIGDKKYYANSVLIGNFILVETTVTDNSGRNTRSMKPLVWIPRYLRNEVIRRFAHDHGGKDYENINRGGGWCDLPAGIKNQKIGYWGIGYIGY